MFFWNLLWCINQLIKYLSKENNLIIRGYFTLRNSRMFNFKNQIVNKACLCVLVLDIDVLGTGIFFHLIFLRYAYFVICVAVSFANATKIWNARAILPCICLKILFHLYNELHLWLEHLPHQWNIGFLWSLLKADFFFFNRSSQILQSKLRVFLWIHQG